MRVAAPIGLTPDQQEALEQCAPRPGRTPSTSAASEATVRRIWHKLIWWISHPVHARQRFLAEHGRTLLSRPYNRLRRGVFRDVIELVTGIEDYVDHHNKRPKSFIGTASASDILEK